ADGLNVRACADAKSSVLNTFGNVTLTLPDCEPVAVTVAVPVKITNLSPPAADCSSTELEPTSIVGTASGVGGSGSGSHEYVDPSVVSTEPEGSSSEERRVGSGRA